MTIKRIAVDESWIETYTGKRFPLLHPEPSLVCIEDIAHALANQGRWTGHTKHFYSVAEHSIQVSRLCDPVDALWGLLHDASEAYLSDLSRPVKHGTEIGPEYLKLERKLMEAICFHFDLIFDMPSSVKQADNQMLIVEHDQLMSNADLAKEWADKKTIKTPPKLACWLPARAEQMFLDEFGRLQTT